MKKTTTAISALALLCMIIAAATTGFAQGRNRDKNREGSGSTTPSYTARYNGNTVTLDFNFPITSQNAYGSCNFRPSPALKLSICRQARGAEQVSTMRFTVVIEVGEQFEPRYAVPGAIRAVSQSTGKKIIER